MKISGIIFFGLALLQIAFANEVDVALAKGVSFIQSHVDAEGNFNTWICSNRQLNKNCFNSPATNFFPGFIYLNLTAFSEFNNSARIYANHLVNSPESDEIWFYSQLKNTFPRDLDTGIINLEFLDHYYPQKKNYLKKIDAFFNPEMNMFNTWEEGTRPIPDNQQQDCVINMRIQKYLIQKGRKHTKLQATLIKIMNERQYPECSFNYNNLLTFLFYLSDLSTVDSSWKNYRSQVKTDLLKSQSKTELWGSPFNNALALLTILNFKLQSDFDTAKIVKQLTVTQRPNGSWVADPLCFMPGDKKHFPNKVNPKGIYFGSNEITASYVMRALKAYQKLAN